MNPQTLPPGTYCGVETHGDRTEIWLLRHDRPGGPSPCWYCVYPQGWETFLQAVIQQLLYPLLPDHLQQQFREEPGTSLHQMLLEAADRLLEVFSRQPLFTLRIGPHTHILERSTWEEQVFSPYFNGLREQIEKLLLLSQSSRSTVQFFPRGNDRRLPWLQARIEAWYQEP